MVSLALVDDTDELMMVTDKGKLIRTDIGGINIISRNTQGVKLINLGAGEKLIGIARLFDENGDPDDLDSDIQSENGDNPEQSGS
jgi:DNA gyrase subunit A